VERRWWRGLVVERGWRWRNEGVGGGAAGAESGALASRVRAVRAHTRVAHITRATQGACIARDDRYLVFVAVTGRPRGRLRRQ
jgi:hypothetical protein